LCKGAHSSAWIEWLPAEQLVEGSSPSEPATISVLLGGFRTGPMVTGYLCHEGTNDQGKIQDQASQIFDFIELEIEVGNRSLEDKARLFAKNSKSDFNWAFANLLKFIRFQKDRADKKEITAATVRNYVKSIKLFCDMADIPIPWKKITRELPKGKKYADDRIPTIEEIRKVVEYPDRRIKSIVYTMASSGIRIGAWDYLQWGHIRPIKKDDKVVRIKKEA
jgi:hypothetical protein